eukprot:10566558-Alexandrium_andersonii.AAC.1
MDEAAVPAGPTGRNVLVQRSESVENGDPLSCSSARRGRRAKRGAPVRSAETSRSLFSADSEPWTRTFRP